MMNRIFVFFSFILFVAVGALIGANTSVTNAASPYDNSYQNTSTIDVQSTNCELQDISTDWYQKVIDSTRFSPTVPESLQAAVTGDGRWGVSVRYSGSTITPIVFWTEDDSLTINFTESAVYTTGNNVTYAELQFVNNSGSEDCSQIQILYWEKFNTTISTSDGSIKNAFTYGTVNYPPDYAGLPVPDSIATPPQDYSLQPNIAIFSQKAFDVLLVDQNFSTFDKIWWTCNTDTLEPQENDEGFAPIMYYEIYSMNSDPPVLMQEGFNSATAQISFKAPTSNTNTKYKIVAWYTCGGASEITGNTHFEFTFTPQGTLTQDDLLQACFTETFPFIDIPACVSNMGIIINALSFGALSFTNNWESSTDCRNLTSLGTWINLPGYQVCPMVPSFVRSTITPFVTFILGLITVRFLTGRMGNDY